MATETYGVIYTDIYPDLPFNTTAMGANSSVTPDDLTAFIKQASSQVTGALRTSGIGYASLDEEQGQAVRQTIIQYCVYKALNKIGQGTGASEARGVYERGLDSLRMAPSIIGVVATTVNSNVDYNSPRTKRFGENYGW